jgi:hypothetical protein
MLAVYPGPVRIVRTMPNIGGAVGKVFAAGKAAVVPTAESLCAADVELRKMAVARKQPGHQSGTSTTTQGEARWQSVKCAGMIITCRSR